jgi:hypothetical protein
LFVSGEEVCFASGKFIALADPKRAPIFRGRDILETPAGACREMAVSCDAVGFLVGSCTLVCFTGI